MILVALAFVFIGIWGESAQGAAKTQADESQRGISLDSSLSQAPLVERVRQDTDWLAGLPSRVVGTAGHEQASSKLLARLEALVKTAGSGARLWQHPFNVVMPCTSQAEMSIANGASGVKPGDYPIYPIWPASVRANTTPADGIDGELVYVGQGDYADLQPRRLGRPPGQIAVMEMAGGNRWQNPASFGARAILLLGSDQEDQRAAHAHLARLPLNVPRFYVPAGPLADSLRHQAESPLLAKLRCQVQFLAVEAKNFYVLVKPAGALRQGQGKSGQPGQPAALLIAAAYDSMSIVPDLAPGAEGAVNVSLALALLERYIKQPPARPVLFAFIDAFAMNQAGVRQMLAALAATDKDREDYLADDRRLLADYDAKKKLLDELAGLPGDEGLTKLHERKYVPLHRYVDDEVARQVVNLQTQLDRLRLKAADPNAPDFKQVSDRIDALDTLKQRYYGAQNQLLGTGQFQERTIDLARQLWGNVRNRVVGQWSDVQRRLEVHQARQTLNRQVLSELHREPGAWTIEECRQWAAGKQLGGPGGDDLAAWREWCRNKMNDRRIDCNPISFMLGLDLSDAGVAAGPRLFCDHLKLNENGNARDLIDWLKSASESGLWTGRQESALDLGPLHNSQAPDQFSVGQVANLTSPAPSFGLPAMTWATLNGLRFRVDTPRDRADLLDWARLAPQIDATVTMLDRLVGDREFDPHPLSPLWSRVGGVVVDQSPGEPVPRVPMRDYIVTLLNGYNRGGQQFFYSRQFVEGVRLDEYVLTGADGMFYFDAIPALGTNTTERPNYSKYSVAAYQLADDGEIVRSVDLNKVGKGVRLDIDITERNPALRRALVFSCRQVTALELFDPRFLLNLPYGTLLDARRAGRPQKMNFSLHEGQMCALLESGVDMRWQVLLRAGSTDNRMALINMMDPEQARTAGKNPRDTMRGFELGQPLELAGFPPGPVSPPADQVLSPVEVSAWDFYNLDERRIEDYAEKGLKSEAINDLHQRTGKLLGQAVRARQDNEGLALYSAANSALSNEIRVYQAVRSLANDVVRAAIFLLLALVPFAFAMERLLFASPRVYRQLGGILGIFAIMTAVLWSFHPAFKISSQPLMIIMAFAIIFMSLLVMSIVYQRFKAQLEEMRSGRAESSGARTSRGGLAVSAIRLGIANMRKRKLRTVLTGTTVVLITFALLCFTSVSSYMGSKERRLSTSAAYTGLLIRQPQQRPMPAAALDVVRSAIGADGYGAIVPQYWWCSPLSPDWRLHVTGCPADVGQGAKAATGPRPDVAMHAALGLAPGEERISGIDRLVGQDNWKRFVAGSKPGQGSPGCFLAAETAEELNVKPGDKVLVAGVELELLATFDPAALRDLRGMTGESIMPINYSALGEEQRNLLNNQNEDQMNQEMASGAGLEANQPLPPLSPADLIILPASLVADLPNCSLRNIGVVTGSLAEATKAAEEMADRVAFPIYYGSPAEVHVLAATALTPKGPKSLMIMLIIAGLIIFNTMLNSIAERKKEIHIYSSLGLAPMHIGILFLAEAATYGLMGSIFGYVVGQGIATALAHFQLLGGATLNYSGTQAIATMVMVIGVTVLSALVPAYMAGKLAAPSDTMKWAVPKPDNDVIRDTLPFTVTAQTANGVAMFLHDYLDAHREGSIGHFSTDNLRLVRAEVGAEVSSAKCQVPNEECKMQDAKCKIDNEGSKKTEESDSLGTRNLALGTCLLGLEATVWLTPYDLGVRQEVRLTIVCRGEADVLEIDVELRRGAGQASSWWKLNRVFLGDLRRQLLGWRKLKTGRILEYIAAGEKALLLI